MNIDEKYVITINRELGSGGRTVGRLLAEELGVQFYDKALIEALKQRFNLEIDEIEKLKGQSHSWWAELKRTLFETDPNFCVVNDYLVATPYYVAPTTPVVPLRPTGKEMFMAETEILKGIAEAESCVVAGRSGFFVFRDHPNHVSILIQASMPFRVKRMMSKQNLTESEAQKTIEHVDRMRENYVKEFTGTSRYDTRNYDLVIAADGKSETEIVRLILDYIGWKK